LPVADPRSNGSRQARVKVATIPRGRVEETVMTKSMSGVLLIIACLAGAAQANYFYMIFYSPKIKATGQHPVKRKP
jgi:hypothetical protein